MLWCQAFSEFNYVDILCWLTLKIGGGFFLFKSNPLKIFARSSSKFTNLGQGSVVQWDCWGGSKCAYWPRPASLRVPIVYLAKECNITISPNLFWVFTQRYLHNWLWDPHDCHHKPLGVLRVYLKNSNLFRHCFHTKFWWCFPNIMKDQLECWVINIAMRF